jgi:O-phosphoseryl-tRNA synthetase
MKSTGKPHLVQNLIQKVRDIFLEMGFDEIENPVLVPEDDVYKQYGPEAPVILDRVYYLAGLPRPDIGIGEDQVRLIKKINDAIEITDFKRLLRDYREGVIESDNLIEEIVRRLEITTTQAMKVIGLFQGFRDLVPEPTKTTLRSHMTSAWFPTIAAMQDRTPLPMKLFSIGLRFRREQKVDAQHLRAHYGASCVIVDKQVNIEQGKKITEDVFQKLGFSSIDFHRKEVTSNYYEQETEYEVYSNGIEVADIGLYSDRALKNYDIKYQVFNLGFGIERVLMVQHNYNDVREVLYPQFYGEPKLSDWELAKAIIIANKPKTSTGIEIANAIVDTCIAHKDDPGPCKVLAWEGELLNKKIKVHIIEEEVGKKLCGPAFLNEIIVKNGNVFGLPKTKKFDDYFVNGISTTIRYIDAFALFVAAEIERKLNEKTATFKIDVKMVKLLSDINLKLEDWGRRYITANNKKINVRGPMFVTAIVSY